MSDRKRTTTPSAYAPVRIGLGTAMLYGFTGGLAGVAAMTVSEKIEQMGTGRPNSYVPGKTLRALLGDRKPVSGSDMVLYNHAFHWGNGAVIGIIRGVMSYYGIVGPFANFMFTGIRLLIDQTLENLTGVGELPWKWDWQEQVLDIFHKAVYACVTGYVTDIVGSEVDGIREGCRGVARLYILKYTGGSFQTTL